MTFDQAQEKKNKLEFKKESEFGDSFLFVTPAKFTDFKSYLSHVKGIWEDLTDEDAIQFCSDNNYQCTYISNDFEGYLSFEHI